MHVFILFIICIYPEAIYSIALCLQNVKEYYITLYRTFCNDLLDIIIF